MDIDEIKEIIANDENRVLELKKTTGELIKGMQSLCAFRITFKRPRLDTNLDTISDTSSDTISDTNSDTLILSAKQNEVLLYCMVERSSREILNHINVTYQNKNIQKFINELVDAGLLKRTIPDIAFLNLPVLLMGVVLTGCLDKGGINDFALVERQPKKVKVGAELIKYSGSSKSGGYFLSNSIVMEL